MLSRIFHQKRNAVTYIPSQMYPQQQASLLAFYLSFVVRHVYGESTQQLFEALDFQGPSLDVFPQLLFVPEDLSDVLDHITPGRRVLAPARHNLHVLTRNQFDWKWPGTKRTNLCYEQSVKNLNHISKFWIHNIPLPFSRGPWPTSEPSPCLPKASILWKGCSEQKGDKCQQNTLNRKGGELHLNNVKNRQLDVHLLQLSKQAEAQRFVPDQGCLLQLYYFFGISDQGSFHFYYFFSISEQGYFHFYHFFSISDQGRFHCYYVFNNKATPTTQTNPSVIMKFYFSFTSVSPSSFAIWGTSLLIAPAWRKQFTFAPSRTPTKYFTPGLECLCNTFPLFYAPTPYWMCWINILWQQCFSNLIGLSRMAGMCQ